MATLFPFSPYLFFLLLFLFSKEKVGLLFPHITNLIHKWKMKLSTFIHNGENIDEE